MVASQVLFDCHPYKQLLCLCSFTLIFFPVSSFISSARDTAVAHQGFTVPAPGHGSWVLSPCLLLSRAGFCCGAGNFSPPGGNQSLQQRARSSLSCQGVLTYPSLLSKCILWAPVQLVPSTLWGWASCCLHALKPTVLCKRK